MAERLGRGLQNLVQRFKSARDLPFFLQMPQMEELKKILRFIGLLLVFAILILLVFILITLSENLSDLNPETEDWKLVWSDEFDYSGLPDEKHWSFVQGDGCPELCGWGNNESQFYTLNKLRNARVENDMLTIEAHQENIGSREFSSAKLVTKGKHNMLNGRLEVRAKNPKGVGTWPAIWMMPVNNIYGKWPKSGEIDIMEHVGYAKDSIYGTIHCEAYNHMIGTQKVGNISVTDNESGFHNYILEWDQEALRWYVDTTLFHTFSNIDASSKEWPFDQDFYLILNLAVGGNWGGSMGIDTLAFPAKFEIDYVRYFEKE